MMSNLNSGKLTGLVSATRLESPEQLESIPVLGPEQTFNLARRSHPDKWLGAGTAPATQVATSNLNEFIAFEISLKKEVEAVFTAFRNEVFYVWVVVNRYDKDVRMQIYERQRAIIDEFPRFEFDFYIIAAQGREPWDLVSESVTLAYRRRR